VLAAVDQPVWLIELITCVTVYIPMNMTTAPITRAIIGCAISIFPQNFFIPSWGVLSIEKAKKGYLTIVLLKNDKKISQHD